MKVVDVVIYGQNIDRITTVNKCFFVTLLQL